MYAKPYGNLVDAGASGATASTKLIESRLGLEVIQGHAFWDHRKADNGLRIYCNLAVFAPFQR